MSTLILIPARAGSKGLPGKNIKLLGGKPLIAYSIEYAVKIREENDVICISSNDDEVIKLVAAYDIEIPFKRPEELASDKAGSSEVIKHALEYYMSKSRNFDKVLLLQPTSPFRLLKDYTELRAAFNKSLDMAVSVKLAKENPYFTLFEENESGYLEQSKKLSIVRRQDSPPVFAYNGSMYLINTNSFLQDGLNSLMKIKKMVMPEERSIDIDNMLDWVVAEFLVDDYAKLVVHENS